MCIIVAKPGGVKFPSEETLKNCADRNKDGIGISWTTAGMVKIKKDFNDLDALKAFIDKNVPVESACLIHFRIATAGKNDEGNRHPFPLTRRRKRLRAAESITDIAVAHNGTLSEFKDHKKYSDTLLFIKHVLADPIVRNNLRSEAIQELLKGYIGSSKLAILNRDGEILTLGDFVEDDGIKFSNYSFRYGDRYSSKTYNCSGSYWADKQCIGCFEFLEERFLESLGHGAYICKICKKDKPEIVKSVTGGNN